MNRAEKDERPLLVPAGDTPRGAKGGSMLPDDPRQKKIYQQWADEYVKNRISQACAEIKNRYPGISEEEATSLCMMSLPSVPDDFRELTGQIFWWGITVTQFIAIQKSLDLSLYPRWSEDGDNNFTFYIFIGMEEISLVERNFPELKKGAEYCQKIIDAVDMLFEERFIYDDARDFWGSAPSEIADMRRKIFYLYKYLCEVDGVATGQNETPPARAWLPRYVERFYAGGKTAQEIAIDLQGKKVPRTVITSLLREEEGFLEDYGQWIDNKGWLKGDPKNSGK